MDGIFIIDKPKGITSRDVVNNISKKFLIKKVGHTGTLDPIATGVLVVCVESATKLVSILTCDDKEYIATVELGIETDTLDSTGKVLRKEKCIKDRFEIIEALNKFKGCYLQEVPIYSAIKINGKKLYEYARENIDVELPKRNVNIKSIELIGDVEYKDDKTIFNFKCTVSKGTYIRSLIRDISYSLNSFGIMTSLRRTKLGNFSIKDSIQLEDVSCDKLINIVDILDYEKIEPDDNLLKKILNGAIIDNIYNNDKILFIKNNEAISVYKIYDKDSTKMKPLIMFKGGIK